MTAEHERGSDPARSLALLWGLDKQVSRGPKPGLSVAQIAQVAIDVADAEGLEALSMQRIAERLACGTMSLYRYVPGKAELIAVMLDVVAGAPPTLDTVADEWRPKLEHWAQALLALCTRHPWIVQIAVGSPPLGPNRIGWLEAGLRAIAETGLTQSEMLATVTLVDGYVRSTVRQALDVAWSTQHTGAAARASGRGYGRLLSAVIDAERFPSVFACITSGDFEEPDGASNDDFAFGLQRILDGIALHMQRRSVEHDQS